MYYCLLWDIVSIYSIDTAVVVAELEMLAFDGRQGDQAQGDGAACPDADLLDFL